ncbi:PREDICTED: uncharacterized protein LOC106750661 [Dinoponera quadriceps]|uniref:Uncharacterized protein LOC106750661 n=1 Tax=Dinoponera quadriceps TaxID=609295 RepID=A0A6P3Y9I8_DINQU|nr:PREDICTED: uncharacterized protein LOC106750661 [Dinoponera quadriceps]
MLAWCDGEPWIKSTEAYRDMQIARSKHIRISTKVSLLDNKQYQAASKFEQPWCPEYETLMKDFALTCPSEKPGQRPYKISDYISLKPKGLNNAMMAVAQAHFIMLPVLYPQKIGMHFVTDEDLDAFCHMWKCYGYFLGIEDEYNFCNGNLKEIKQRLRDLSQHWTIQNFKEIQPEYVHVTKCMIEALNYYIYIPYKSFTLFLTETLNLNMPNLYASLSYAEWIAYIAFRFLLHHALKFSSVRSFVNKLMCKMLEAALNIDSKKLAELHEKSKRQLSDFDINL